MKIIKSIFWGILTAVFIYFVISIDRSLEWEAWQRVLGGVLLLVVVIILTMFSSIGRMMKLKRIIKQEGIYGGGYARQLEKIAKGKGLEAVQENISLLAVYLGVGEFEKVEEVLGRLPMSWVDAPEIRMWPNRRLVLEYKAMYYNNTMAYYFYRNDREKMEVYYNAGFGTFSEFLEAEWVRPEVKASVKDTLASYHVLRKEYEAAMQLLDEIEDEQNTLVVYAVKRLKARIYIETGEYEKAGLILHEIRGKNEAPYYNQVVEEMLERL